MDIKVTLRKSEWIANRPWMADLVADEGTEKEFSIRSWQQFYPTKKSVIAAIKSAEPDATIIDWNGKTL